MKKILLICILSCLAFVASCSHTHEKAEKRVSDATHHWYPCTDSECDAALEKVEHTWGKGEITTPPQPSKDGVMSYLCTVCQRLKQEPIKAEPTHKVTEEQWKKAFSQEAFLNYTVVFEETRYSADVEHKTLHKIQADNDISYVVIITYENGNEKEYSGKFHSGIQVWTFTDKNQVIDDVPVGYENPPSNYAVLSANGFERFLGLFDSFTFNEENECYEAENLTFESGISYSSVSVKLKNGWISSITASTTEKTPTEIKAEYSDYGTTKPLPPMAEQPE